MYLRRASMKVLITGAAGFIGTYLASFLHSKEDEVFGTYYELADLSSATRLQGIRLTQCDIRNEEAVDSLVQVTKPDRIYHLAAQSLPVVSWKEPALTIQTNVIGTINLFESVIRHKPDARILVACSSAEYGIVSEESIPVKEDHPLKPLHPYGVSKVAQDLLAYQYFVNFGVPSIRVRIFNTTGPGKTNDVCSDFARRIAEIEEGLLPSMMKVGNTRTRRDITDVRDAVVGLYLAMEKGVPGEVYNLSRGVAYRISDLLDILLNSSKASISIEVAPELLRPTDEPIIVGDSTKLREQVGWQPAMPIEKTLEDMLSHCRERTK
jgi:GDP-4-dehydro-6-deoxy-D-mannose reductase